MPEETFRTHVTALIAKKLEKDKNLAMESARHWNEITLKLYRFDFGKNSSYLSQ